MSERNVPVAWRVIPEDELAGYRATCAKSPHTNLVWGNEIVGSLIAMLDAARISISDTSSERDALMRRLTAMFPLFEEARDALTAISMASASLHGIRLDLADRMDEVGDPARWAARDAAEAPK